MYSIYIPSLSIAQMQTNTTVKKFQPVFSGRLSYTIPFFQFRPNKFQHPVVRFQLILLNGDLIELKVGEHVDASR
jgi:hypothetical protein